MEGQGHEAAAARMHIVKGQRGMGKKVGAMRDSE